MQGRFLLVRAGGSGAERSPRMTHVRVSKGSMTPSISKCDAMFTAFPCAYMRATISS